MHRLRTRSDQGRNRPGRTAELLTDEIGELLQMAVPLVPEQQLQNLDLYRIEAELVSGEVNVLFEVIIARYRIGGPTENAPQIFEPCTAGPNTGEQVGLVFRVLVSLILCLCAGPEDLDLLEENPLEDRGGSTLETIPHIPSVLPSFDVVARDHGALTSCGFVGCCFGDRTGFGGRSQAT